MSRDVTGEQPPENGTAVEPGGTDETAAGKQVFRRVLDSCVASVDHWVAARTLRTMAVSALIGAGLHWLAPAWWPLGAAVMAIRITNMCAYMRTARRRTPRPAWTIEAGKHAASLAERLPSHVVAAAEEARAYIAASRWRWPGVYVVSPDCPHTGASECADQACTGASAGTFFGPWVVIAIGRNTPLAERPAEEARAVLMHEAMHQRGWQPIAQMLTPQLHIIGPGLATWIAAPGWAIPALAGVYLAFIGIRWVGELAADLASARHVDPRAQAAYLEYWPSRVRASDPVPWIARAAARALPFHPPGRLRVHIMRSRLARRLYHASNPRQSRSAGSRKTEDGTSPVRHEPRENT